MTLKQDELPIGTRVRWKQDMDIFPLTVVEKGDTGTVDSYHTDGRYVMVKLDKTHDDLEEWDNCAEMSFDKEDGHPLAVDNIEVIGGSE